MSGSLSKGLIIPLLALALAGACAVSTFISVQLIRATLNTIFVADQWETVNLYERSLQGVLSLRDVIAQHNEHRIFLPRLVFLLDYALDDGRNRVNFATIVLIQILHIALFIRISSRIGASYPVQLALALLVVLLFFGVYQYENFIFGFQLAFLAVQLLFTACAWSLASARERWAAGRSYLVPLVLGITLGVAATLTMANGALALLCVAFTFLLCRWNDRLTYALAAVGLVVFTVYAATFTANPGHTSLGFSLTHPVLVSGHIAAQLGAIFFALGRAAAIIGGIVAILGLCASLGGLATGYLARNRANVALVSVMIFAAATATLTALGRSSFGIEQAHASRYCSTSAMFWAALTCLAVSVILEKFKKSTCGGTAVALAYVGSFAAALLMSVTVSQKNYRLLAPAWNLAMLRATTALLVGASDEPLLRQIYPDPVRLGQFRATLMKLQVSIFADTRLWPLGARAIADRMLTTAEYCLGGVEKQEGVPDASAGTIKIQGWSWDARRNRPFERLVLLFETGAVAGYAITPRSGWVTRLDASAADRIGSKWYGHARLEGSGLQAYGVVPGEEKLCLLKPRVQ